MLKIFMLLMFTINKLYIVISINEIIRVHHGHKLSTCSTLQPIQTFYLLLFIKGLFLFFKYKTVYMN